MVGSEASDDLIGQGGPQIRSLDLFQIEARRLDICAPASVSHWVGLPLGRGITLGEGNVPARVGGWAGQLPKGRSGQSPAVSTHSTTSTVTHLLSSQGVAAFWALVLCQGTSATGPLHPEHSRAGSVTGHGLCAVMSWADSGMPSPHLAPCAAPSPEALGR